MLKVTSESLRNENIRNMLELQKLVLKNVQYDLGLFRKEMIKSKRWLDPDNYRVLVEWVSENFADDQLAVVESLQDAEVI